MFCVAIMKTAVKMTRLDENRVALNDGGDFDITLFANEAVQIDRQSVAETANLFGIGRTIEQLNTVDFFGDVHGSLNRCLLTPDFHKGAGIPVGTVMETTGFILPRSAGTDIGCGMRLVIASITRDEFAALSGEIDNELRHTFFEGGRDIPMSEEGRAAMLREGILGMAGTNEGIWKHIDPNRVADEFSRMHRNGSWPTNDLWNFQDYVKGSGGVSRDAMIASIGGGNHFVEIQYVDECLDRHTCYDWGIKKNHVSIMAHTGSVDFGSAVGGFFMELAKKIFPHNMEHPEHGFYPLPTVGDQSEHGAKYLSAMGLAANFAIVNRFMLTELVLRALSKVCGKEVSGHLVYDAPHNLVWSDGCNHIHRKGATPAEKFEFDENFPNGHPVIIPGSMGDASYVLRGHGAVTSLCSAPHGAGRLTARGESRRGNVGELDTIRIVTKIDPKKTRRDVADELRKNLMEEAPSNYKAIGPAIDTVKNAGIADPVARLMPLLTIKG